MLRTMLAVTALGLTVAGTTLAAQTIPVSQIAISSAVTLKTFTPVDSFFVNPTQSEFTVTLNNTISGGATKIGSADSPTSGMRRGGRTTRIRRSRFPATGSSRRELATAR